MEGIKEAFSKVKEDISFLYSELNLVKQELSQTRALMIELGEIIKYERESKTDKPTDRQTNQQTDISTENKTQSIQNTTNNPIFQTNQTYFKPLEPQNLGISIGNKGVPTDRQTNQQTDRQTHKSSYNHKNTLNDAIEALNSLDNLKKELRLKFKRLTEQEMAVFSLIYQFSEEYGHTDYKEISEKIHLTESSIRDYVGKLIKKGIPVEKKKENNKNIKLFVSSSLKKVASLQTILQLRNI